MGKIYYKNSQNTFSELTYTDFGAAPASHTHTASDIIQKIPVTKGGTGVANNSPSVGMYYSTYNNQDMRIAPVANGVFGYYDRSNTYPSFQVWPLTAGGTGHTTQNDVMTYFGTAVGNDEVGHEHIFNYQHCVNAGITSSRTNLFTTMYLPWHVLPGTTGTLSLYAVIWSQNTTNKGIAYSYAGIVSGGNTTGAHNNTTKETASGHTGEYQYNRMFGFTDVPFEVGVWSTTENCIYKYYGDGTRINTTTYGNIGIGVYTAGPCTYNDKTVYGCGHYIRISWTFSSNQNTNFTNNIPMFVVLNRGLSTVTNKIVIPAASS